MHVLLSPGRPTRQWCNTGGSETRKIHQQGAVGATQKRVGGCGFFVLPIFEGNETLSVERLDEPRGMFYAELRLEPDTLSLMAGTARFRVGLLYCLELVKVLGAHAQTLGATLMRCTVLLHSTLMLSFSTFSFVNGWMHLLTRHHNFPEITRVRRVKLYWPSTAPRNRCTSSSALNPA